MFTQQEWNIMQSRQKRFDYVEVGVFKGAIKGTKTESKYKKALKRTFLKKKKKKKKKPKK